MAKKQAASWSESRSYSGSMVGCGRHRRGEEEERSSKLTLNGNSVDKPSYFGFGLPIHPTGQDSSFVRSEDQVPRSADPVRGR